MVGEQRRRVDIDLRREVRRARPGCQHDGVELGGAAGAGDGRGTGRRDAQRVDRLVDDRVTGSRG